MKLRRNILLSLILAVLVTVIVSILSGKSESYAIKELQTLMGRHEVTVKGFMSPLLGDNTYFYLTSTPYNHSNLTEGHAIPIYLKGENKAITYEYTNQPVRIRGTLITSGAERQFKDSNGLLFKHRIINAKFEIIDDPEYSTYSQIAKLGIYEDIQMYQGLFDNIINKGIPVEAEIDTSLFDDMLLALAVNHYIDDELAMLINTEAEIAKKLNSGVNPETLKDSYNELTENIELYFKELVKDD